MRRRTPILTMRYLLGGRHSGHSPLEPWPTDATEREQGHIERSLKPVKLMATEMSEELGLSEKCFVNWASGECLCHLRGPWQLIIVESQLDGKSICVCFPHGSPAFAAGPCSLVERVSKRQCRSAHWSLWWFQNRQRLLLPEKHRPSAQAASLCRARSLNAVPKTPSSLTN